VTSFECNVIQKLFKVNIPFIIMNKPLNLDIQKFVDLTRRIVGGTIEAYSRSPDREEDAMDSMRNRQDQPEGLMTAADVAGFLAVSLSTVRGWVAGDEIPVVRIGRLVRFRRRDVDRWLEHRSGSREGVSGNRWN